MSRLEKMLNDYGEVIAIVTAAKILNCHPNTIRKLAAEGKIRKCCNGRKYDTRSIVDYIERDE